MKIYELNNAKKPLIILGSGARVKGIREFIEKTKIPVFLTWGAMDLLPDDHPLNMRDFGVTSQRAGNFVIEESDFIIALGTKMDTHQPINKKVYHVDCDIFEYAGGYFGDVEDFINILEIDYNPEWEEWRNKIIKVRNKFNYEGIQYKIIKEISNNAKEGDIIITDAGQTLTWTMQSWKVKENQRLFSAFNHSPMGYSLPAIIGAHHAFPNRRIICFIGDGGLQMNLQELQTIKSLNINFTMFVINNEGYGMIMQTLSDWDSLDKDVACSPPIADLEKVSNAFGFNYKEYDGTIPKQTIVNVKIPKYSKIENKLKFGDELTDLTPKLINEQKEEIINILK